MILWVIEIKNDNGSTELWTDRKTKPKVFWTKKAAVVEGHRYLKSKSWQPVRYQPDATGVILR